MLIVEKCWIGVPFTVLLLLIGLFSGRLSDLRQLAEVRAFEDEQVFQIDTGKGALRIPFSEPVDARVRRNFTPIELKFKDRTILFMPERDHIMTGNIGGAIDYIELKVPGRKMKR